MQKNKHQKGFGLVEVIVSIAIFTLVMVGVQQLGRVALYNYETSKNRTIAYNVIQESFEKMRNQRDTNAQSAASWSSGITDGGILTQMEATPVVGLTNGAIRFVVRTPVSGAMNGQNALAISATVSWQDRRGPQSLTATTYLTDWKAKY